MRYLAFSIFIFYFSTAWAENTALIDVIGFCSMNQIDLIGNESVDLHQGVGRQILIDFDKVPTRSRIIPINTPCAPPFSLNNFTCEYCRADSEYNPRTKQYLKQERDVIEGQRIFQSEYTNKKKRYKALNCSQRLNDMKNQSNVSCLNYDNLQNLVAAVAHTWNRVDQGETNKTLYDDLTPKESFQLSRWNQVAEEVNKEWKDLIDEVDLESLYIKYTGSTEDNSTEPGAEEKKGFIQKQVEVATEGAKEVVASSARQLLPTDLNSEVETTPAPSQTSPPPQTSKVRRKILEDKLTFISNLSEALKVINSRMAIRPDLVKLNHRHNIISEARYVFLGEDRYANGRPLPLLERKQVVAVLDGLNKEVDQCIKDAKDGKYFASKIPENIECQRLDRQFSTLDFIQVGGQEKEKFEEFRKLKCTPKDPSKLPKNMLITDFKNNEEGVEILKVTGIPGCKTHKYSPIENYDKKGTAQ